MKFYLLNLGCLLCTFYLNVGFILSPHCFILILQISKFFIPAALQLNDLAFCRFSVQDYNKFRSSPINEAAIPLAEKGKIGALNLLFKRHPFSLSPFMLDVLSAIPETVPVQTYAQLLPGNSPPASNALREEDWVECDKMISFIDRLPKHHSSSPQIRTEPIVRKYTVFQWPSTSDLSLWYKSRAREIDSLSGQLDNSMCLIDMACRKGISELQQFLEDITYLHQLIYSDDQEDTVSLSMTLSAWEQLPDYEKFKMMLMGVKEKNVLKRLQESAIPFMKRRSCLNTTQSQDTLMVGNSTTEKIVESFLVQWLKEISSENKLEICLIVIGEGFTGVEHNCFINESEVVDCALQCIYMCSATDRWNTMSSILSKLPLLTGRSFWNVSTPTPLPLLEKELKGYSRISIPYGICKLIFMCSF